MAQSYRPLQKLRSEKLEKKFDEDVLYWRRMKQLAVFQEPGNLTSICFSTTVAEYVASTSSIRLSVFDASVCEPTSVCSRFKEAIYGVTFRKDGRLLAVGSQDGRARVFDFIKHGTITNKAPLRTYKSHSCPVHTVLFSASGKKLVTMGDDGSIKVFDVVDAKAEPLRIIIKAHSDRIRCGDSSNLADNLFASGSYDHTAKIWDIEAEEEEPLVSVEHGAPIESVLFLPGDSLLVTAGGQYVKIWNLAVGGKLLHTLHNHHKTVTSLCLASKGTRLLSGGLDKRVNVYRLNTGNFDLVHSFTMPASVFALSMSINDTFMAVGMGNLLGIFRREAPGTLEKTLVEAKTEGAGLEYKRNVFNTPIALKQQERGGIKETVTLTAPAAPKIPGGRINDLLRKFRHCKAVDVLFKNSHYVSSNPDLIIATFQEIYIRGALHVALAGRNIDTLRPLINFLCRYLVKSDYFPVLFLVAKALLDVYVAEELDVRIVKLLQKLLDTVGREISLQKSLNQACGALEVVFTAASKQRFNVPKNEEVFGDVVVVPKLFVASDEEKAT